MAAAEEGWRGRSPRLLPQCCSPTQTQGRWQSPRLSTAFLRLINIRKESIRVDELYGARIGRRNAGAEGGGGAIGWQEPKGLVAHNLLMKGTCGTAPHTTWIHIGKRLGPSWSRGKTRKEIDGKTKEQEVALDYGDWPSTSPCANSM